MGFFGAISNWMDRHYEKKVERMKEKGKCPDCGGIGFDHMALEVGFFESDKLKCQGCQGTGLFSDWQSTR